MIARRVGPTLRYDWFICLARHPDHVNRDPRRAWQYECCSGKHSSEEYSPATRYDWKTDKVIVDRTFDGAELGDIIYYFENEQDMLMFNLRWQ